jgi:DNA-binding PadR family transcriptional regulator
MTMDTADLSELEGCVLGVICRSEPCTAYSVRAHFQGSLTTSWRASTGAIYPLIRKLARIGLISEEVVAGDRRGSRQLCTTAKGRAALKRWVEQRPEWLGEPSADAIRTRFQFIATAGADRPALITAWRADTETARALVATRLAEFRVMGDATEATALRGAELQLEARLRWLEELSAG